MIYSWPGWWKTSELPPFYRCWGVSPAGAPLGAGTATFLPSPSCRRVQPGPARKGSICLCFGGPGVPPAASPLPPPLFIAFHQHLEFEPIRCWLTPSWGMELGETCAAREGGSPRALPAACGGPQRPSVDLRTIWGVENPRSILAPLFPAVGMVGTLPHPCPTTQTWGCSASPLAVLLVLLSSWVLRLL